MNIEVQIRLVITFIRINRPDVKITPFPISITYAIMKPKETDQITLKRRTDKK